MRVADYIVKFIYETLGVEHVFGVVGGGAMFLNDAFAQNPKVKFISCHHEQAAAMAASGYARYSGKIGICCVTTGCGGTNAITGVLGAYQDNIPMLIISGQCKCRETMRYTGAPVRQLGVQEADIIEIVKSITKYACMVTDSQKIKYHLEEAIACAFKGSPGPVWLDIPLDIQNSRVEEEKLEGYKDVITKRCDANAINSCVKLLNESSRPIIIAGHGIRLANSIAEFKKFIEETKIPIVFSELGLDILSSDYPLNLGKIGTKGNRAANFALQNSDLIISIGSRLSVSSTGQEYDLFAREAKLVVVDINPNEHKKKTVKIDLFVESDAKAFLEMMNYVGFWKVNSEWLTKCQEWKLKWPICLPEYSNSEKVNLYYFLDRLSAKLKADSVIICDAGSSMFATSQGIKIRESQRLIFSAAQSEMGFTLPASVGVAFAKQAEVIGICGDGSLQMNIQELQTVKHHNIPVKLFVWNNDGYSTIRQTQAKFFKDNHIGTDSSCGVSFPNLEKIADAYGIFYVKIPNSDYLELALNTVLQREGPVVCEVMCDRNQVIQPVISSKQLPNGKLVSCPSEDMYPFLPRQEFFREMIVKPEKSSDE